MCIWLLSGHKLQQTKRNKRMRKQFEVEFNYDKKTYITTGSVNFSDKELIGTTFGEEVEILTHRVINCVEIDSIDMVDHGDYQCVLNDKEIKEIAIEAMIEKALNN